MAEELGRQVRLGLIDPEHAEALLDGDGEDEAAPA